MFCVKMAKWNNVFLKELSLISMTLYFGCSARNIESDVCLERAIDFAWWNRACWFQLKDARDWLEIDTYSCSKKCTVKIEGLKQGKYYELKYLNLRIDGLMGNSKTIDTLCRSSYDEKTLEINCSEDVDISKNLCTFTEGCSDLSKTCVRSSTEQVGFCVCKSGYIGFGNECLEGNLKLNDWCQRSEQCSGTVGSVCRNYKCVCRPGYTPLNDSTCFFPGISDDLCTSHEDCGEESKRCSMKGQVGICTCKSGFIGFGNECLKGNLSLHESCQRNEQCSVVFGSVCLNNTCSCRESYVSLNNDSECSLPPSDTQASVQGQKDDNAVSVTVGAVFGGLILGIVLTVLVVIIYKNIRNGKPNAGKKQDQKVEFFNNTSYETEREPHQNHSTVQRTIERKIVNVPPFAHSMDIPVTENTYTNKSSMENSHNVNNDAYNHLHEKEEDSDIDETYDHAHENINRTMEESDYSNLNTGRRYMGPDVSGTEDNDYDERDLPGDYCSLEKQ